MNSHTAKIQNNVRRSVVNDVSQQQNDGESSIQFADIRTESGTQKRLQKLVNNSPQTKKTAHLQSTADNYSFQQHPIIQQKENYAGVPGNLKFGSDTLSGYAMNKLEALQVHQSGNRAGKSGLKHSKNYKPHTQSLSLVIQHALSDPIDFKTDKIDDEALNQISTEVQLYNTLPYNEKSVPARLHFLQQLSCLLYSWYNRQDTYELSSLDSPIANKVRQFEKEVEQELTQVVGTASSEAAPIIDRLNLGKGEQISVDEVWQNLLSGKGFLKIVGPTEFQKKVQAMLFRILNTEAGRKLLIQIASGGKNKKTVTIGSGDIPPNIKNLLFESSAQESKAIPQIYSSKWSWASKNEKALMHRLTEMIKVVDPETPDEFQAVNNPEDLHKAINSGAKGIKAGKKPHEIFYQFAEGAKGAYVALVENEETLDNAGEDKKSIHTPAFVTLAHELGHALNQLAGAATLNNEEIFRILAGSSDEVGTFEDPGPARKKWSNVEELFTILGIENAIRGEVGLAKRGAHAGAVDPTLIEKLNMEKQLIGKLVAAITALDETLFITQKNDVRVRLWNLYSRNIQGISQLEKRNRCREYENEVRKVSERDLKKEGWQKLLGVLGGENNKQDLDTLELYLPDLAE